MKMTQEELHSLTTRSDFEQRYSLRSLYSPEEFRAKGLDPFASALPCWYHGGFSTRYIAPLTLMSLKA